jgi:hypothetical protein
MLKPDKSTDHYPLPMKKLKSSKSRLQKRGYRSSVSKAKVLQHCLFFLLFIATGLAITTPEVRPLFFDLVKTFLEVYF